MSGEEVICCCSPGCWVVPAPCCPDVPFGTPRPYIPCDVAEQLLAQHGDPLVFEWPATETCYLLTAETERSAFLQGPEFTPVEPFFECCSNEPGCCCEAVYHVFEPCDCASQFVQGTRILVGPITPPAPPPPTGCFDFSGCGCHTQPPPDWPYGFCGQFTGITNVVLPTDCVVSGPSSTCFQALLPGPPSCNPDPCCGDLQCCGTIEHCDQDACAACPCCVAVIVLWSWGTMDPCFNNGTCCACPAVSTSVFCQAPSGNQCFWDLRPLGCGQPLGSDCSESCGPCCGQQACVYQKAAGSACVTQPPDACGPGAGNQLRCFSVGLPATEQAWDLAVGIRNPCCGFVTGEGVVCICDPTNPIGCTGSAPNCQLAGCQNGARWEIHQDCGEWTPCPPASGWQWVCGCGGTTGFVTIA